MTQQELAARTGMTSSFISDKINNRGKHGMWLSSAKKIAVVLDCSIDDLYEWIPDKNAPYGK